MEESTGGGGLVRNCARHVTVHSSERGERYLGAFAQVAADLHVAVVGRRQLLQHLLPLVGLAVGLLQAAELLVGGLGRREAGHSVKEFSRWATINSLKVGPS